MNTDVSDLIWKFNTSHEVASGKISTLHEEYLNLRCVTLRKEATGYIRSENCRSKSVFAETLEAIGLQEYLTASNRWPNHSFADFSVSLSLRAHTLT